jgi:hypothetical protein
MCRERAWVDCNLEMLAASSGGMFVCLIGAVVVTNRMEPYQRRIKPVEFMTSQD